MARADRITELTNKQELYSDFLTNLNPHPVSGIVLRNVNEVAVTRAIRNLVNTNRGERLYQPNVGCDIRKLLFEPMVASVADVIKDKINDAIKNYEPRAKVLQIEVRPDEERNAYLVRIVYMLVTKEAPITVNIVLSRVR